jgi:hypothetical protein
VDPAAHRSVPQLAAGVVSVVLGFAVRPIEPDDGPLLVSLRWQIDPERRAECVASMRPVRRLRRRDGAMQWGLYEDVEHPGDFIEHFTVATFAEHERQHERPTAADAQINECAQRFLLDGATLESSHLIAADVRPPRRASLSFRRLGANDDDGAEGHSD